MVIDARTQHRLSDQLFSVPKCVRLSRFSEKPYELSTKILRAVPEMSKDEIKEIVGEDFVKWDEGNISEFQRKKAKRMMSSDFPIIDEKDETHTDNIGLSNLEKYPADSWRVSVSVPGADVLVPQESKPSSGLGCRGVILHGIA